MCGRRIWKEIPPPACECGFTQSICLKLLSWLLLSLVGVEVFFANSAEFRNPAVVSWRPLSHLALEANPDELLHSLFAMEYSQ